MKIFIMNKWMMKSTKCFSGSTEIMCFFSFFALMWYMTLINLQISKCPCIPVINQLIMVCDPFLYCLIWFAIVISPFSFLFLFIPVFSPFFLMSLTHRLSLSKNQLLVLLISILLEGISVLFISSLIFIIFSFNWLWALFFFF